MLDDDESDSGGASGPNAPSQEPRPAVPRLADLIPDRAQLERERLARAAKRAAPEDGSSAVELQHQLFEAGGCAAGQAATTCRCSTEQRICPRPGRTLPAYPSVGPFLARHYQGTPMCSKDAAHARPHLIAMHIRAARGPPWNSWSCRRRPLSQTDWSASCSLRSMSRLIGSKACSQTCL